MLRLHVMLQTVLWPEKKASSGLFVFWRCQSALEPVTWQGDASSSVKASKYICMRQRIGFTRNLKGEDSGLAKETVHPPWTNFSSQQRTRGCGSPWLVSARTSSARGRAAFPRTASARPGPLKHISVQTAGWRQGDMLAPKRKGACESGRYKKANTPVPVVATQAQLYAQE